MRFWLFFLIWIPMTIHGASRKPLRDSSGMVAADNALASQIGARVLADGGNAFDAAVATGLALGVLHPHSSGIGGGLVGTVMHADSNRFLALDARETVPYKVRSEDYLDSSGKADRELSTRGGLASGVPLELRGYELMHQKFGSKPWKDLVMPAATLALEGFEVSEYLASNIVKKLDLIRKSPHLSSVLLRDQQPLKPGDRLVQKALGHTLESIAQKGADAFYMGEIADSMVLSLRAHQGKITRRDLVLARARFIQPLKVPFREYEIVTMPPPSSGGLVIAQMAKVLEPMNLKELGHNSSEYLHVLAEAMKHAYADRAGFLGDERFVEIDRSLFLGDKETRAVRESIKDQVLKHSEYGNRVIPDDAGTTHFSIADRHGNLVAITSSINTLFGSGLADSKTGVVFNNHMDDFSLAPGVPNAYGLIGSRANAIQPLKKPLSSMSPTLVLRDSRPYMAVGGSGGPRIISGTMQVLLNVLVFGRNLQEAVDAPRIHHQWFPDSLSMEKEIPRDVSLGLLRRGHKVDVGVPRNVVQAVRVLKNGVSGASDPRKMGLPAGPSEVNP